MSVILDFVYDNSTKKWYEFITYGWVENTEGFHLRKAISSKFMKKFEEIRLILTRQIYESDDIKFKTDGELTIKT